jgi:hypothetical protein
MFRIALIYVSILAATAALVLSLNALEAGTLVSLAAFALFAISIGFSIGYFVDRIPEISRPRRTRRRPVPPRT